jgi:DNA recombination-dependent growth factor C
MLMTEWLKAPASSCPKVWAWATAASSRAPATHAASVRFTAFDLGQDDILKHIEAGLQVSEAESQLPR